MKTAKIFQNGQSQAVRLPSIFCRIITAAIKKNTHVILRLDRSIQVLLDSPVKPGNDDFTVFNLTS